MNGDASPISATRPSHVPRLTRPLRSRCRLWFRRLPPGFLLQLALLVLKLLLLSLSLLFSFAGKMNPDGNRRHRDSCIGEQSRRNLVAPAAHSVRSLHHGCAHDPAHSDRHIADHPALKQDGDQGVPDQPHDGRADAVRKGAHIRRVLVPVNFAAHLFRAVGTRQRRIHPIVSSTQRLLAKLAAVASRLRGVLGRSELRRRITQIVTHGPDDSTASGGKEEGSQQRLRAGCSSRCEYEP